MSKLLIYINENEKFDFEKTVDEIRAIDGVKNVKVGKFIGAVFECDYVLNGQSTIIRISPELETITIEGLDDTALQFAVELQQRFSVELHAIDMDYSFNVSLMGFSTVSEFKRAIDS